MTYLTNNYETFWTYISRLAEIREKSLEVSDDEIVYGRSQVIYALDSNIVESIIHPEEKNFNIFNDDSAVDIIYIKYKFYEYLFEKIPKKFPLIILPGHDREIISFMDRYVAQTEKTKIEIENIIHELTDYSDNIDNKNVNEDVNYLKNITKKYSFYFYQSKIEKLFLKSIKDHKLHSINADQLPSWVDNNHYFSNYLTTKRSSSAYVEEHRIRREWENQYNDKLLNIPVDERKKRKRTREPDLGALSRLELMNKALSNLGLKAVLLTMDQFIYSICDSIKEHQLIDTEDTTFADEYIRLPFSLFEKVDFFNSENVAELDNLPFLENDSADVKNLSSLIDFYLAPYTSDNISNKKLKRINIEGSIEQYTLSAVVKKVIDVDNSEPQKTRRILSELINYSISKDVNAISSNNGSEELRQSIRLMLEKIEKTEEEIDTDIDELIKSAISFGIFFSKQIENNLHQFRRLPIIYFDSFPLTTKFVSDVLNAKSNDFDFNSLTEKIEKLKSEDSTHYSAYMASAVIFASVGLYKVAKLCIKRALKISIKDNSLQNRISGREAWFLEGYLDRIQAKDKKAVLKARRDMLVSYEPAFATDMKRYLEDNEDGAFKANIIRLRDSSERISHLLQINLMNIYEDEFIPEIILRNMEEVKILILKFSNRLSDLRLSDARNEYSNFLSSLGRALFINTITMIFLRVVVPTNGDSEFLEVVEPILEHVSNHYNFHWDFHDIDEEPILSKISVLIAILIENKGAHNDETDSLLKSIYSLSEKYNNTMTLTPYEKFRVEYFKNKIDSFIKRI